MPKLPDEFQTRIEINSIKEQKGMEIFVMFDLYDKKAEIIRRVQNKNSRTIFYFDRNEQFFLQGR